MNNVKTIRDFLGLTQKAFGLAIGTTQSNVMHYENGTHNPSMPSTKNIKAYAAKRGLKLSLDQIQGEAPLPKRVIRATEQASTKEP